MTTIVRAHVAHTPQNPFFAGSALEAFEESAGSTLEAVLKGAEGTKAMLGAPFTLAREESIAEVRLGRRVVSPLGPGTS